MRIELRMVITACLGLFTLGGSNLELKAAGAAALYVPEVPEAEPGLASQVEDLTRAAGYQVERLTTSSLTNSRSWSSKRFNLLAIPFGRLLPVASVKSIEAFLTGGGKLLVLGLPAWDDPIIPVNGRWISRSSATGLLSSVRAEQWVERFEDADLSKWTRSTDDRRTESRAELGAGAGGRALHVRVEQFKGWDTWASPRLASALPEGHELTCFEAKGGPRTHELAVEWVEQDGSRWIAVVPLTSTWKHYVLSREDFRAWEPPAGRGGAGDRVKMNRAVRFTVGISQSHTAVEGPSHEYWLDEFGTAANPLGHGAIPERPGQPHLESLAPAYQFYDVQPLAQCEIPGDFIATSVTRRGAIDAPAHLQAIHPRPRGIGFKQERPWRWQPLLEARSSDGQFRGTIGVRTIHLQRPFRGGVWACFTPRDPAFYAQPAVRQLLTDTVSGMGAGLFLAEGGSESFTAFGDQSLKLGASAVNFGASTVEGSIAITVRDGKGGTVWEQNWPVRINPGSEQIVEQSWTPGDWPQAGFVVETVLSSGGKTVDKLSHHLSVWRPSPAQQWVEQGGGGFMLNGKPWKAYGINYMPSSGVGLRDWRYFEHWMGRGAYDPVVIERDLRRIKGMGMNAVSVFIYHQSLDAQHLLDFLRQCEGLGLRVNLSLRPGTPLNFRWPEMKELIEHYRLASNSTVFAYDLAWEPSHATEAHQQQAYASAWGEWVLKKYRSIAEAEQSWGVAAPRKQPGGRVSPGGRNPLAVPPMAYLTKDGPWRKLVADYRGFLDGYLETRYAEARRLVRSVDSLHPVSFRMQHAGDPTLNWEQLLPYDFPGLANAVDIWEPEAYGRIGDWDKVKAGRFTVAYARLCDPAKPVVWAEMGCDILDKKAFTPHPDKSAFCARYYADFHRMLVDSGSDGVFFWWYPGGYRVNENSDFGIINPDGTDREVTRVIRREGPRFLTARKPGPPDLWLEIDRDADARGLFGIYETVKGQFWQAADSRKNPGLRWKKPPGSQQ